MPRYKSKNLRSQWSQDNLQLAVSAVRRGESKNSASKRFKIPRRTLNRYLQRNTVEKHSLGRRSVLTKEEEADLAGRIVRLADVGYPLTKKIIRRSVYNYCERNQIMHPFSRESKTAGRCWLEAFLKRQPQISVRRAQSMNPARAQKLNKFIVNDHFEKLHRILTELDIMDKPERIFNVDEKGCRLTLHHQQTVLAQKGSKRVHLVAPEHAQNVTIVSCGSASGNRIPPTIIFKGKRLKPEWCDNFPPGTLTIMTPKGSMTCQTFNDWIKHLCKYKLPGKCLLIFDGASCHLDPSIVETAASFEITLYCLPSNTTHELQPMDKSVFKSFEHYWDEQVLLYWTRNVDRSITKQRFGEIFSIVWDKCMTPQNITAGFSATGIYPFNPDAIPEIAFAPSILTENQNVNIEPQPGPSGQRSFTNRDFLESSSDSDDSSVPYDDTSEESSNSERESKITDLKRKKQQADESEAESSIRREERISLKRIEQEVNEEETNDDNRENEDGNISFHELLETPYKKTTNTKRRTALNSRALVVTKNIFGKKNENSSQPKQKPKKNEKPIKDKDETLVVTKNVFGKKNEKSSQPNQKPKKNEKPIKDKDEKPVDEKSKKPTSQKKKMPSEESWFCKYCQENIKKDMRKCIVCKTYVHEECVGLTKEDKSLFICPCCE